MRRAIVLKPHAYKAAAGETVGCQRLSKGNTDKQNDNKKNVPLSIEYGMQLLGAFHGQHAPTQEIQGELASPWKLTVLLRTVSIAENPNAVPALRAETSNVPRETTSTPLVSGCATPSPPQYTAATVHSMDGRQCRGCLGRTVCL